jgi:hypothetical protein
MDLKSPTASRCSDAVKKRVAILFCGFEPLDAEAQRIRFQRTAAQTAKQWNCAIETGALAGPDDRPHFDILATGPNWRTETRLHIHEHSDLIAKLRQPSLTVQIARGFGAFASVIAQGGLFGYFRWAWRFALFFVFPFLFMALALGLTALIATAPLMLDLSALHLIWSLPAAFVFFRFLFLPRAERLHTTLLFCNWRMAVGLAGLNWQHANQRLETFADGIQQGLSQPADEYVIASHSMGSNVATHALGIALERDPNLFRGKKIVFATYGGALLQCALLRSATNLRHRAGMILNAPEVSWIDVQCLTDPVNFYKAPVARATGHGDAPAPTIIRMRVKSMLSREHYTRIRKDILRVHRQYVMGADTRVPYDFGLMMSGPISTAAFASFNNDAMPPIDERGYLAVESDKSA